jgi:hypothetical protein
MGMISEKYGIGNLMIVTFGELIIMAVLGLTIINKITDISKTGSR